MPLGRGVARIQNLARLAVDDERRISAGDRQEIV